MSLQVFVFSCQHSVGEKEDKNQEKRRRLSGGSVRIERNMLSRFSLPIEKCIVPYQSV